MVAEKTERNEALYNDFKSQKFSLLELQTKYQLTASRIYMIVNRMRDREVIENGK